MSVAYLAGIVGHSKDYNSMIFIEDSGSIRFFSGSMTENLAIDTDKIKMYHPDLPCRKSVAVFFDIVGSTGEKFFLICK